MGYKIQIHSNMTKVSIIERLLNQGHIVLEAAEMLLNRTGDYMKILKHLTEDGPISNKEALIILSEDPAPSIQKHPDYTQGPNPYFTDPNWTGKPGEIYCQTSTWEYPDTKFTIKPS
jgi:hypothetical protein|tara:strand:+ start:2211 stop:2561 length:351 start_codon:yes stop_codon:yes gene_type:complete